MKTSYLDRDTTGAVKGVALVFMFIHHFFTFPSWLTGDIHYPWLEAFANAYCSPTNLCVGIFAFLTGYFYAFTKKKTLGYSLRKITDLLISYWIVYLPLLVMAVAMGVHTFSVRGFVYEAFGLETPVMSFCWYVYFYCLVMLVLPLLTKAAASPAGDVLVLLVVPGALLGYLVNQDLQGLIYSVVYNVRLWYPCVACGYLFGKYDLFARWFDAFCSRVPSKAGKAAVYILMCWAAFRGRYYVQNFYFGGLEIRGGRYDLVLTMDILYAPLFVYGLANLLQLLPRKLGFPVLNRIGKYSMLMWFFHCVFFNVCKEVTQRWLYFPKNPVLVTLNGLILCWLAAALVEPLLQRILRLKNNILY